MTTTLQPVDFSDVQGLVRFGYRRLTEASFLLLRIRDAAAARHWLGTAPVASAVEQPAAPATALHLAFTHEGLAALGLPGSVRDQFSVEFRAGMATDTGRSRLLGDVGANAPSLWSWGGTPAAAPHVVALFYAQPGHLHDFLCTIRDESWSAAFNELACLGTDDLGGVEPFGFADGVSQPTPDWERRRDPRPEQLTYTNVVSLGEFLLGYPNEYGRYTDRPLLAEGDPLGDDLLPAEDDPQMRDFGRNGSYLVLRTLEQDVHGFWRFLDAQARDRVGAPTAANGAPSSQAAGGGALAAAREELAEAMVGRRRNGDPLVPRSGDAIPGVAQDDPRNDFTFDEDAQGTRCPFGAHVRRANPRNADLPTPPVHGLGRLLRTLGLGTRDLHSDSKASVRFHRLLRRGREYGTCVSEDEAIASGDTGAHGIHFIALAANIARQFEFVQSAWITSTKFDTLSNESDPLLGTREPIPGCPGTSAFSRPRGDGVRDRLSGLPQFVTVRGGAYFFLPSLRALRTMARLGDAVPAPATPLATGDRP